MSPYARATNDWPVRIGGLMRCCTQTLADDTSEAREGDTRACPHCQDPHGMILRNGAWEWAKGRTA